MSDVVHVRDDTGIVHVLGDSSVVHVFDDTSVVSVREDADVVHVVLVRDDTNIVSVINFGAGGGTANVTFPLQGTSGSCLVPTYSFGLAPTSGLFHDPASPVLAGGGEAVVLSWDSCASRIDVGESVRLTALNGDYIEIGAAVSVVAAVDNISLLGTTGVTASAVTGDIILIATAGAITSTAATNFDVTTNAVQRLRVNASGAWLISSDAGSAGEVLTSAGNAATPVWATPAPPSFPILASNGTCAAPAYSFTASPDSGMFYTGTAVRISDDNCTDYISVGASIELVTSASAITITSGAGIAATAVTTISLAATGNLTTSGANNFHTATSGNVALAASSQVTIATAATLRLAFSATGEWLIGGTAGTAGQLVTSNGAGTPPTWQTAPTSFPGYGSPVTTACANADGISVTTARADHVHRSEMRVQDEGSAVGARCSINFIGGGVVAVDNPGSDRVDITIPGAVSFPGYGSPATTACANADGGSSLAARADHVHRSEMRVQDEGVAVGARCSINFIGAGVVAVDNSGADRIDVTIPGGGTPDFPVLAPSGTCAAPSYSFASAPSSGLMYTGTAVRLADDNCADYVEVGEGIAIVSTANGIALNAFTDITLTAVDTIELEATAGDVIVSGEGLTLEATTLGVVIQTVGGTVELSATGEILLNGLPGTAGDVLTSNGPALPPTWQPPASTLSFPLAAPDGTCGAPSYSFTNSPDSGVFYTGTAVRLADDNCANYVEVGEGIAIVSTANAISISNANASTSWGMGGDIDTSTSGSVSFDSGSAFIITTGGVEQLNITTDGDWQLNTDPGTAGDVLTSNGPALPPTWQAPGASVTYPLAAPNGTCAAPSYSFTAAPTSGMHYTGTAVRVSDSTCADYVEVGTGVNIVSTAGNISLVQSGATATITIGSAGDIVILAGAAQNAVVVAGAAGQAQLGANGGSATINTVGAASLTSASNEDTTIISAGTGSVILQAGLVAFEFTPAGEILLGGSAGTAGDVITSAGAGADAAWAAPTGGSSPVLYDEETTGFAAPNASGTLSFVIGSGAVASATDSFAFGTGAQATAAEAIAIGETAIASAAESIVIGSDAITNAACTGTIVIGNDASTNNAAALRAIAIGNGAGASDAEAIALGEGTQAFANSSIAIGSDALVAAAATSAIAIGDAASCNNAAALRAVAIGNAASGLALECVVIGDTATAASAATGSIAIGDAASTNNAAALRAIAIGAAASATGLESIALGEGAIAAGSTVICIGSDAIGNSGAQETISIGNGASTNNASALAAIAIGRATTALATESVSIGDGATNGTGSAGGVAIGNGAATNTARSIAIGNAASAPAQESICIGDAAVTNSACTGTIAIGNGATTSNAVALRSIAIGNAASAIALESIAIGDTAITNAACTGSIAIGNGATTSNAAALRAIAIGDAASAIGLEAIAFGEGASAPASTSICIGSDAVTNAACTGTIAIGDGATTNNAAALRSIAIGNTASGLALESIAIGDNASTNAAATGSISIGDIASTSAAALRAIAIGPSSGALGADAIAIGESATCSAAQGIAIGSDISLASAATGTVAMGDGVLCYGTESVCIGIQSTISLPTSFAVAVGPYTSIADNCDGSIAIGYTSGVGTGHNNSVVLGSAVTSTAANQITLGNASVTEVIPGADITTNLGSSARRWKSLYLQSIIAVPTNKTVAATPYAVLATDFSIFVDSSGGATTITLPAAPENGRILIIKKVSTDANNVTIDGNGKTLDGAATIVTAATNRPSLMFLYDSSANDWRIV